MYLSQNKKKVPISSTKVEKFVTILSVQHPVKKTSYQYPNFCSSTKSRRGSLPFEPGLESGPARPCVGKL